jgi:hypothetical protein
MDLTYRKNTVSRKGQVVLIADIRDGEKFCWLGTDSRNWGNMDVIYRIDKHLIKWNIPAYEDDPMETSLTLYKDLEVYGRIV